MDAGARVAAPLVEGDQLVAYVDHGHAHGRQPPAAGDALGLGQDRLAHAATLQVGAHGEHAEVAGAVFLGHVRAGQQRAVALGEQDDTAWPVDVAAQAFGIDALAVQHVRFGGPAGAAGVAAVGGGDQLDQGGDVGVRGRAESEGVHARHCKTAPGPLRRAWDPTPHEAARGTRASVPWLVAGQAPLYATSSRRVFSSAAAKRSISSWVL